MNLKHPHIVEAESGNIDYIIKTTPVVLDVDSEDVNKVGKYYLPYSTGFEIECEQGSSFDVENFLNIPYILDVNVDSSEQRFRIPNGIKGIQCLYNISQELIKNSLLNKGSGIHYHIDFTDCYESLNYDNIKLNSDWILKELDTWEYKGNYNTRKCEFNTAHNWVRFQNYFKTMEIRIGEMTFDFSLLFKRIVHANQIARKLKNSIQKDLLSAYDSDIENVIKNRIQKI